MRRWGFVWPLLGVGVLVLAGCGGAADVAVGERPAPTVTTPTPTASATPDPAEPTAPAPAADDAADPEGAAVAEDRPPAGDPPPEPAGGGAAADEHTPSAPPGGEPSPSSVTGSAGNGTAAARDDMPGADERAEDREPAAPAGLPAIAIERPAAGSEHGGGPVTAEGQATVYEGTVLLTLVGPDGSAVEEAFATATAGAPERGRWSHTFATAADTPGRWQVVAAATDPSDGEGHPPARAVAEFHVVGSG